MRSLRARLLLSLLGLAAVGLLVAGAVTYAEQRSFLLERIDQQVVRAQGAVAEALDGRGPGSREPSDRRAPRGARGPELGPAPGTFAERRSATGDVTASVTLDYGQSSADVRPDLPASLPLGRLITVDGVGDGASRYRVQATRQDDGTQLVVAVPLGEADQTLNRLLRIEAIVIAGVLLALAIVAWVVVRVGLLPLDRMGHAAGAIAGGDLSARVDSTDPRTEVGRLGIALNRMLERLEAAFVERQASEDRLRRFLADASHELRTPLASIRGYAELFRMGAARDPVGAERAMRRIEDEATRMGLLVEDMLTLARLDEIAHTPHEPVDLARLAGDAVDDARVVAPDRDIALRTSGSAVVLGDADQLRQVLANLVRNALVHTPPGSAIEVAAVRTDGEVRLTVRDHGPGLPEGEAASLFERFWRAEAGRQRGPAGAGLGLAIVSAIVAAHDGWVGAADAEDGGGDGAEFTVGLPALS
jgi:two-component system OmpR family sensor kinase